MSRIFQAVCQFGPEADGWVGNSYPENDDPLGAEQNAQSEARNHTQHTHPPHGTQVIITYDDN